MFLNIPLTKVNFLYLLLQTKYPIQHDTSWEEKKHRSSESWDVEKCKPEFGQSLLKNYGLAQTRCNRLIQISKLDMVCISVLVLSN